MCTVTIIPLQRGGVRLVTSRDELRTRAKAEPPAVRRGVAPGVDAMWPTDPVGGGAWVAGSSAGLILAVLNVNPSPAPAVPAEPTSRGLIIPEVIAAASAAEAADRAGAGPLERFAPFRLVAVDQASIATLRWDGRRAERRSGHLEASCFTSSGLGDRLVEPPRLELFDEWFRDHAATPEAQDAFHRHRWPDRPELSVLMARDDARTVSITTVAYADASLSMRYLDVDDDAESELSIAAGHALAPHLFCG